MKKVFASLILLSCLSSFAMSGKTPPSSNGSGGVQCAWYDGGSYEEHSPHISREDCIRSGHASCNEQCYTYDQVCSVEGSHREYVKDEKGNPIMKDILQQFSGRDRDMWRAQDQAMQSCRYSGIRQDTCRITGCHEEANQVR